MVIKPTLKNVFCLSLLATLLHLPPAWSSDGVLHFQGAVVENDCELAPRGIKVAITCNKQGKWVTHTLALPDLNAGVSGYGGLFQTSVRYLDTQNKLAIVSVTWH